MENCLDPVGGSGVTQQEDGKFKDNQPGFHSLLSRPYQLIGEKQCSTLPLPHYTPTGGILMKSILLA